MSDTQEDCILSKGLLICLPILGILIANISWIFLAQITVLYSQVQKKQQKHKVKPSEKSFN